MKAKEIASLLGNLASATTSLGGYNQTDIDIDIPDDELLEPDPIFTVEHEKILDENEEKALKSVLHIVNTIVPEAYQNNPIIKDKISQDADLLGLLYYQQNMNNVMIKVIMDTISKGDTTAKLFDSYTKLMSIAKDFNKQINEMQNQFRKYYIDTYMDLQHKDDEDQIALENGINKTITSSKGKTESITYNQEDTDNYSLRETSTKDSVLKVQDWKREQFKKQYEDAKKQENK